MAEPGIALKATESAANAPRIGADALAAFVRRAFQAAGLPPHDAGQVADLMVQADLRGSDTHGVIRLPLYVRRIKAGGINRRPNIRVVSEKPAAALIDGDNGMGHLVMRFAAETAIAKARQFGVAWVGARMSNHAGPAALYATMPDAPSSRSISFSDSTASHWQRASFSPSGSALIRKLFSMWRAAPLPIRRSWTSKAARCCAAIFPPRAR